MVAPFAGQLTAADTGTIQFRVNNHRHESLPCRIHLVDAAGKPQKTLGMPFWNDLLGTEQQRKKASVPHNTVNTGFI